MQGPSHGGGPDPVAQFREAIRRCCSSAFRGWASKDVEIDERARTYHGVFGKTVGRTGPTDVGWWRYRVPGLGQIDWERIIHTLYVHGYDGTIAARTLQPLIN